MSQRAALYLRISEDRSGEHLAVGRQREDCVALVRMRGAQVVGEYTDNDISAAGRKRRPAFTRLLADVRAGHIDLIAAWAMDRLARNPRDRLALVEACRAHQVVIALVRGSDIDLTTAAGRLVAGMLGEVSQHEIDIKSERQVRQARQAAEAGKPGGGVRAFGYLTGGLVLHPREAPVVAELYRRFLAGASLVELSLWLNNSGWSTPRGHKWRANSVKVVLANPRNCGLRGMRPIVDQASGRRAYWHEVIGAGQWPAVVDEPTWRAVMAVLTDPDRRPGGRDAPPASRHLLSGIAVCGVCGMSMISSSSDGHRVYRCSSKLHLTRRAEPIEKWVQTVVLHRLQHPDTAGVLDQAADRPDLAGLQAEAVLLRAQLDQLAVDYADGLLDRDQLRAAGESRRARLRAVQDRIAAHGRIDVVAPLVAADGMGAAVAVWHGYPTSTRREVLARLLRVEVLRVRPGRPKAGAGFDTASVRMLWRGGLDAVQDGAHGGDGFGGGGVRAEHDASP